MNLVFNFAPIQFKLVLSYSTYYILAFFTRFVVFKRVHMSSSTNSTTRKSIGELQSFTNKPPRMIDCVLMTTAEALGLARTRVSRNWSSLRRFMRMRGKLTSRGIAKAIEITDPRKLSENI